MRNTVIIDGSLGDTICALPIAEQIKKHQADVSLLFKCRPEYEEIAYFNPHIDVINAPPAPDDRVFQLRWAAAPRECTCHVVDWYAKLAQLSFVENRLPTIYKPDNIELEWPFQDGDIVVAVDTRAGWPTRRWAHERFEELARRLKKELGAIIVEVGKTTPDCLGRTQAESLSEADVSLVDRLTIRQTACALSRSSYFLGNDSGLAHLAAAVRTKAFVIFGPVSHTTRAHGARVPPPGCATCMPGSGRTWQRAAAQTVGGVSARPGGWIEGAALGENRQIHRQRWGSTTS